MYTKKFNAIEKSLATLFCKWKTLSETITNSFLKYKVVSGNYTATEEDMGKVILFTSNTDVNFYLTPNLSKGWYVTARTKGLGIVSFVEGSTTIESVGTSLETQFTSAFVEHEGDNIIHIEGELT